MTNRDDFGANSTTNQVLEGIDLKGKIILITGAASGLGAETARALASKGAKIIIAARDMDKAKQVQAEIQKSTANQDIEIMPLELASLAKVKAFADDFLKKYPILNILINNAGIMACPYMETEDGFELQFGSNHLGHFLLTCLLAPALKKGAPSRVISLSSLGHRFSPVVFEDIHFKNRPYNKWLSYGQSKTANALFAVELDRRLGQYDCHAFSVHPGVIRTPLARHMTKEDIEQITARHQSSGSQIKSVEEGAATSVYAATAPELEGEGGAYLENCSLAKIVPETHENDGVRDFAINPQKAKQLWELSEKMIKDHIAFRPEI